MFVQTYQHKLLTDLNDTGFGIKYENNLSAFKPPHWHQAMELLLFVEGRLTCKFANSTLHTKPGQLYLINANEVHETRCSRDAVYLCVHILPSAMCRFVPDFDRLQFSLAFDPQDKEKSEAYEKLQLLMEEILHNREEEGPAWKLERQARLFAVASILVRHFSQTLAPEESHANRADMARLEPVLEYVQLHHGEELTLEGAANSMGLNKEYFCRLFKKSMGTSFLQYVYQIRTAAVCRELETSPDSIGIIAERHGFKDPKMLNQYFKEIYGCTPSEKRKFFREVGQEQ